MRYLPIMSAVAMLAIPTFADAQAPSDNPAPGRYYEGAPRQANPGSPGYQAPQSEDTFAPMTPKTKHHKKHTTPPPDSE
jgi:hypothetical protein